MNQHVKLSFVTVALLNVSYANDAKSSQELQSITITEKSDTTEGSHSYTIPKMSSATKMNLSPLETPQSVSVVTSEQMEDFHLTTINDALEYATGISVEKMESDRTMFTSRGFTITNILEDGVNLPLS